MSRTLLVEDNVIFRKSISEILNGEFPAMDIEEASNGEEALQHIQALPPNLILMDIKLPDESGLKLTQSIKATHPEIPIIILTSYNIPEYRDAARQAGANAYLVKSISSSEEIVQAVKSAFSDSE
jgi:DNA-binding NarL/FixJ family response regulator